MGRFCYLLSRYDERTYQQLLAPLKKREILRSLPPEEVKTIFESFLSMNPDLVRSVSGNPLAREVPCIFQTPQASPPPASQGTLCDMASRAFAAGDVLRARQLLAVALQTNAEDPQAAYLARVFARAGAFPAEH